VKIVDIAESYSDHGGGVRTYVRHKLRMASRLGHEIVIVAPGTEDREQSVDGGRVVWVKSPRVPFDPRYGLFARPRAVHDVLDREAPDIIEGSSALAGGWFAASWTGTAKRVFVFHTDLVAVWPQTFFGARLGFDRVDRWSWPLWGAVRSLASKFDATVVSGDWLSQRLSAHGVHNTRVVPFGVEKSLFSPKRRSPALRSRLLAQCGAPPGADLLVAVGRLDPEKRIGLLLDAFGRASKTRPLGLLLVGRGALEKRVIRRARALQGVHALGHVSGRDTLAEIMASADGLLHGSAAETYGLVVAEALCAGLPVIVPDRGGAGALAHPGCSERYQAGSAYHGAQAMGRMLDRDRAELRRSTAAAAREIPDLEDHFRQLFDLYSTLAASPAGPTSPSPPRAHLFGRT